MHRVWRVHEHAVFGAIAVFGDKWVVDVVSGTKYDCIQIVDYLSIRQRQSRGGNLSHAAAVRGDSSHFDILDQARMDCRIRSQNVMLRLQFQWQLPRSELDERCQAPFRDGCREHRLREPAWLVQSFRSGRINRVKKEWMNSNKMI